MRAYSRVGRAYNSTLRQAGAKSQRWRAWQDRQRTQVILRWRRSGELCEGCGEKAPAVEVDHVWGRDGTGAKLAEPWCSLPELCAALCRPNPMTGAAGCHQIKTNGHDDALVTALRRESLRRLAKRFPSLDHLLTERPLEDMEWRYELPGLMRRMIHELEGSGTDPMSS